MWPPSGSGLSELRCLEPAPALAIYYTGPGGRPPGAPEEACTAMPGTTGDGLTAFNGWPRATAEDQLRSCCAAPGWAGRLTGDRPFHDAPSLHAAAEASLAEANWPDLLTALAAHPRIGERAAGTGTEATWSRGEQSAAATADEAAKAELAAANVAYERRFDHVFLICASGRSIGEIGAELRRRLDNAPAVEREVVRAELTKIVHLRLDKMLAEAAPPETVSISTHVLDTSRGGPAAGVPVRVDVFADDRWTPVGYGRTGADGRVPALLDEPAPVGTYRLVFDTARLFGNDGIYPEVVLTARLGGGHWHLPLLVGPYSYSTYRGS